MKQRSKLEIFGLSVLGCTAGFALLCAVLFGFLFFRSPVEEYLHRRDFDSVAWQAEREERFEGEFTEHTVRLNMLDDLLRRYSFEGMTRAEVLDLLGEPEHTGYFREYDLVYWLGPERGWFGVDSQWLTIRLDSTGVVTDARVTTD